MEYIGKIDKGKLGIYCDKVITEKIVLTEERKKHIQERHPGDYEKFSTGVDKKRDKNSILTFWKVRNSVYNQLINNKKILYKSE